MSIPQPGLPDPEDAPKPKRNPFGRRPPTAPTTEEPQHEASRGHMGDRASKEARRPKRPADTTDILLSVPTELSERLESVLAYTYPHTGVKSKQAFIRAAIARACAEHEARFNDGDRWPAVPRPRAT
ncbi:hypothetical protein ACQPXH_33155 (plasmid) [Nocardia sp. CA-135953]|uniref:hypothetical protein n=1 Tax=Nocardia sp. CA-135953 TaxID=3239978 RepID=UPI003D951824